MKTLADIKRRIKVGAKMHTIYHKHIMGRDESGRAIYKDKDMGVREVTIKQSNQFALATTKMGTNEIVNSWLAYPRASQVKIVDENTFTVLDEVDSPTLTYKFVD